MPEFLKYNDIKKKVRKRYTRQKQIKRKGDVTCKIWWDVWGLETYGRNCS